MSTVYLIHFSRPYKHARHYMGWTDNLDKRFQEHLSGRGARLMQVVVKQGIKCVVARTWEGSRKLERRLKKRKESPRLCPICRRQAKIASRKLAA